MPWFTLAKAWLKKNWKWLVFPVGIALYLLGYYAHKKPVVVAPESVGAAAVKEQAKEEAKKSEAQAEEERLLNLATITNEHANTIKHLTDEQKEKAKELSADPVKLNDFLIDVGKSIRN